MINFTEEQLNGKIKRYSSTKSILLHFGAICVTDYGRTGHRYCAIEKAYLGYLAGQLPVLRPVRPPTHTGIYPTNLLISGWRE